LNTNPQNSKPYDLEERTALFAKKSRTFIKRLPRTIANVEDAKQFVRASGSIGANYIEANEAIGKKGFRDEDQDLPQRSQGKLLLASVTGCGGRIGTGAPATFN
jgi:hypothetical protein